MTTGSYTRRAAADMTTMRRVFNIGFEGELDPARLSRFQKVLNLRPLGRLTDTEDTEFGHRALRNTPDHRVWLDLWRRDSARWSVTLSYADPRPSEAVVARCRAEVLAAIEAVGLAAAPIWPAPTEPVQPLAGLEPPGTRALSVRLAGGERLQGRLKVGVRDRLQRGLHLRREPGGVSGNEFGWRYVRFDPPAGSQLLQLYDDPDAGTEIALLVDREPPSEEVVAGCRLQIEITATLAGMTVAGQHPEPAEVTADDWGALAGRAAGAESFPDLLRVVGSSDETAYELTRGRLLAVTSRPEWMAASPQLRRQADNLMLGLPVDPR